MSVIETRKREDGAIRRRRLLPNGQTLTTLEVPMSVVLSFGAREFAAAMARWHRGELARESAARLRVEVKARPGWKATAVAHDLGCSEARVRQIRGGP